MSMLVALLSFREPVNAWTHALGLLLSLPATVLLWKRCSGERGKQISLLIFGLSLATCYLGSTLFHAVRLSGDWINWFDQLDHIGIFILIAGSYTPMAWNQLQGRFRWITLGAAWLSAAVGSAMLLTVGVFSMFWSTCFYMMMGWGAVVCYIEMSRVLSHRQLFPLLLGGILYSVGALINLVHWPVLWAGVFGAHALFHCFVIAGSVAHFLFMLRVVAPLTVPGAGHGLPLARPAEPVALRASPCVVDVPDRAFSAFPKIPA